MSVEQEIKEKMRQEGGLERSDSWGFNLSTGEREP